MPRPARLVAPPRARHRSDFAVPLSSLIARYDHVLLDLDGCVWVGDEPTPGAVDAVAALRAAGKSVAFVTNDTQLGTEEYVQKLWRPRLSGIARGGRHRGRRAAVRPCRALRGRPRVVIGSPALHRHVEAAGLRIVNGTAFASRADVVVVAFTRTSTTTSCATRRRPRGAARS